MSEANSGGVVSSASFTAATISTTGSSSAVRISSLGTSTSRGSPDTGSRPRTPKLASLESGATLPTASFTFSAVVSPIASRCVLRNQAAIVSSRS